MTTDAAAQRSGPAREGLLARHPLVFFFIIAYVGSWLLFMTLVLSENGVGILPFGHPLLPYVIPVGVFLGPFLSGFVMTGVTEGRAGIGRLLRRIVLWRVGLRWYLFAFIVLPAVFVFAASILPGALASFQGLSPTIVTGLLFFFVYVFTIGGGLNEEPGWRGFALPRLQRLHGPLVGSLILGPLWGLWHVPVFWWPGYNTPPTVLTIVVWFIAVSAFTIVMTWFFNNTKGSVFMAILIHTSHNVFYGIVPAIFSATIVIGYGGMVPLAIGNVTLAVVLIALTRGRLGYDRYLREAEGEPDPATAR
jgi:membrane protease YdiL (CAAX protease family)